jgi:hypothetical protein
MSLIDVLIVIAIIVLVLWLLGLIFAFMPGPLLWLLLVVGIVCLIIWLTKRFNHRNR